MQKKIEKLKRIVANIDTMIWFLEGNSKKQDYDHDGTISTEMECYDTEGKTLQEVIDSILEEHGDELLPTVD